MKRIYDGSTGLALATAHRLANVAFRRLLKKRGLDLTPEQWGVLVYLWENERASQDELAAFACVDKSSMSRILSLMEGKGLVNRRVDRTNERKKDITLTQKAFDLRGKALKVAGEVTSQAMAGVDPADAETCLRVLAMMKRNLQ